MVEGCAYLAPLYILKTLFYGEIQVVILMVITVNYIITIVQHQKLSIVIFSMVNIKYREEVTLQLIRIIWM